MSQSMSMWTMSNNLLLSLCFVTFHRRADPMAATQAGSMESLVLFENSGMTSPMDVRIFSISAAEASPLKMMNLKSEGCIW